MRRFLTLRVCWSRRDLLICTFICASRDRSIRKRLRSGCAAAVAGGWTSVCPMPNTQPINDNAAITRYMIEQAEHAGLANIFPIGAISKESNGAELAEMGEMKAAGAVAVSDDGRPVPNAGMMRRAMEYAKDFDLPVVDHCEDKSLSSGGVMHEGKISLLLGLKGMPALAEEIDAVRDIILAKETGAHIHIAHVSTKGAIEAVRRAKNEGINVTCEVTPHHFTLTDKVGRRLRHEYENVAAFTFGRTSRSDSRRHQRRHD